MGATTPAVPFDEATFLVDWYDPSGDGPARLQLMLDEAVLDLDLLYGKKDSGVYSASVDVDGGCTTWFAEGETSTGRVVRFPEEGAYGYGPCSFVDAEAGWLVREDNAFVVDDGIVRDWRAHMPLVACATTPHASAIGGTGLFALVALFRRRR
jgi:MYXO-CTERM domain-containing protein